MTETIEVCPVDDLPPGESIIIDVGEIEVGVFNIDGEFHALYNSCAHQQGPVCEGVLMEQVEAEHTELGALPQERNSGEYMLVCPWHGWSYDVKSGVHTGDEDISVPTFPTSVEEDVVYVEV